ncbi:MAG: glycosyltransferase family 4 protein [Bacteroidales bacterium]|nr:glycosyltransferase family 4 protein [Bacteroidales bacterium]
MNVFGIIHPFFDAIILKNTSPYLERSKTVYLPNGCNQDFFRPIEREVCIARLGLDAGKRYILYMDSNKWGRTQKRQDRFDATVELLRSKYGHTDVEAVKLFNTPREEIPYYFNACAMHMLSSDFEGSPNSVKECMCCNVPVVSTDVGNVKDMIGDIPGCYVVDQFTAEALAKAADQVLTSDKPFSGRERFLAKGYSMEAVAGRLFDLYKDVCI